ncbi:glycosyltransferase [Macrococcus armenti]|uniref:glycosyltransferase n=1 Tax=Macrococcus armenti TaxID=2875764 RepID=UPI001CCBF3FA|nr:glycosyltransferase [Macrococcus armenti]UBH08193.1 glycosyltransferase [Macrococcus armenti]UBH10424.1 glycosyltransferase [Macrococcus armenti]UBH14955.1 glycosyltransferase [Macrococcus armenti]UBH17314.1 glycosyltransferase [Macrococcus armenti]UBH19579.1 glycosyltransferase [Macrococcus armenti]
MKRRGCGCLSILLIPFLILLLYIGFNVFQGYRVNIDDLKSIEQKQTFVSADSMPKHLTGAFVALEDKRFYKHGGVSFLGTTRAIFVSLKNGESSQGGSTITQQLAKTYFFNNEKSISRKIKEVVVAKRIEHQYSKEQILSYYLNTIYFGDNLYSVEDAANHYFNTSAHVSNAYYPQVTVLQSALLASAINAPSIYQIDDYTHDAALKSRTKFTLEKMLKQNVINRAQYNEALAGL